jgi:tripartite-type tricarboxylate transporter receptor subunit TctC
MDCRVLCVAIALTALIQPASAQQYPSQPVRIVVPFSAGSNTDAQARVIADKLAQMWKQQVIVENRPGIAGTASVAAAPKDGYTLMLTSSGHPVANVISPSAPFDPVKDFAGITQVSVVSASLIVPPDLPANNLKEFIALVQKSPGKMNFGSAGTASTSYLAGEIFKQVAKVNLVHVPYKGAPEAMNSILRNDTQIYFASTTYSPDLITSKKIKVLAVSSAKRAPRLPEVPTAREAGLPDYVYDSWFGVMAPAGTPTAILNKVSADIASALRLPDVEKAIDNQGLVVATQSPAEFDKLIQSEATRYGKILREAGIGGGGN